MSFRFPARRLAAVASTLLLAAGASACGDDESSSAASGDGSAPATLTIGYQAIPNGDLVVKNQGWLEQALPGTKIEWKAFDSGGAVNEAFTAGSLDIGLAGSSPVSRGLSQPIEYRVPWIHDVIGEAESLVVKPEITSIKALEGKKIAAPLASTTHYALLAALDDAGVDASKVDIIDAEPDDIYAAWTRGDIDGAYVWNPNLAKIVKDGGTILTTSAELAKKGIYTYDLAVVSKELAEDYPQALATWVEQQDRAVKLYRDDIDAWAKAVGAELNLDVAEVKDQAKGLIFLDASEQAGPDYLGGGVADTLYKTAAFNKKVGQIDSVLDEPKYGEGVTADAVKAVAGK